MRVIQRHAKCRARPAVVPHQIKFMEAQLLHDGLDVAVPGPGDPGDLPVLHIAVPIPVEADAVAEPGVLLRPLEGEPGVLDRDAPEGGAVEFDHAAVLEAEAVPVPLPGHIGDQSRRDACMKAIVRDTYGPPEILRLEEMIRGMAKEKSTIFMRE